MCVQLSATAELKKLALTNHERLGAPCRIRRHDRPGARSLTEAGKQVLSNQKVLSSSERRCAGTQAGYDTDKGGSEHSNAWHCSGEIARLRNGIFVSQKFRRTGGRGQG
jgi:hypothetical protein